VEFTVAGPIIEWRGPAPFTFVALDEAASAELEDGVTGLSYGWGCIPATVTLGATTFTTSLMPREGAYLVPVKKAVKVAERVDVGDEVRLVVAVAGVRR
jgi:hypothetical protein